MKSHKELSAIKYHQPTHPLLVVVITEARVLELLYKLVLLLLPLGKAGQDLPHGGDGEPVGLGHGDRHQRNEPLA